MELGFEIEIDPTVGGIRSDLVRTLDRVTENILRQIRTDVAENAPDEMRALMREGGQSAKGEPPRKRSGTLSRSLKGQVMQPDKVEFEMVGYAGYLDPTFKDENFKGAGWADRPFIELGTERALVKSLAEIL